MDAGVLRDTHRFMGTRFASEAAWVAVRGKPSRMKDAEGSSEGCGGGKVSLSEGVLTKSSTEEAEDSDADAAAAALESVKGLEDKGKSHPRDLSSCRMSRRIMSSGTSAPERIAVSARIPGVVC